MPNTVQFHRVLRATPERVYRAFLDPDAMVSGCHRAASLVVVAYVLGLARGELAPRPQLQPNSLFLHPDTSERITRIRQVDADRLWRDFTRKIDAHPGH